MAMIWIAVLLGTARVAESQDGEGADRTGSGKLLNSPMREFLAKFMQTFAGCLALHVVR
jgi:hypothetical protein